MFRHKLVFPSLALLDQHNIPYSVVNQQAGDIAYLASRAFNAAYNVDYKIASAVNFFAIPDDYTAADFAAFDQASVRCICPAQDNLIFEDEGRALNRRNVKLDAQRAKEAAAVRPSLPRSFVIQTRQRSAKRHKSW